MKNIDLKNKIVNEILNLLDAKGAILCSVLVYKIKGRIKTTEKEILQILNKFNMDKWVYSVIPEQIKKDEGVVNSISNVVQFSHSSEKGSQICDAAIKILERNEYMSINELTPRIKEELTAININASERLIRKILVEYSGNKWHFSFPLATPEKFVSINPLDLLKARKELLEKFLNIKGNKEKALDLLKNSFVEKDMPKKKLTKIYKKILNDNLDGFVFTDEDVKLIFSSLFADRIKYIFQGRKIFLSFEQ
ncbi:hypothetical protein [Campylobacter sp. RM16188]|uniref:hypothetical protein n=1 Tax=Campylobacter sp. RM16188 TaxID=1705725 RepID=UPI001557BA35|nr:hypothetical protein [Campylobacter sp. RM16188]